MNEHRFKRKKQLAILEAFILETKNLRKEFHLALCEMEREGPGIEFFDRLWNVDRSLGEGQFKIEMVVNAQDIPEEADLSVVIAEMPI